jgi:hypothetical protein
MVMRTRAKIFVAITIILMVLLATTYILLCVLGSSGWPGGMSGGTPVNDPKLIAQAKTAIPIASALKKYFVAHGAYPAGLAAVQSELPAGSQVTSADYVNGWHYIPATNSKGFSLWQRLGWDPSLEYQWDGVNDSWIFHPGDGSPDRTVSVGP